ncbi:MAG: amino acid permease [Calditrichaeota bacterium]|nr:amino acid permease [Calditrichota bacterium]
MGQTDLQTTEKLGLKELVAMGIGGMVGGGIFSVLGIAVATAGHAAPLAFALGGVIALLTGWTYVRLGLAFRSDGGSFTYLEHAFRNENVAGIGGWILILGYVGTLSLYAYTFGVYGSAMLGHGQSVWWGRALGSAVLLLFLGVNLYGVKSAGSAEDLIVVVKVAILALFAVAGLLVVKSDHLLPVFDKGVFNALMGTALIFVAYEGFELIPNAVHEMRNPERDLGRGILLSIGITVLIYVLVSLVAVGNLTPAEITRYKEYALAVAAKPFLGQAGFGLIGLGALLSTASAINATLFGTARLTMVMAQERELPRVFSFRERTKDVPWVGLLAITAVTLIFSNTANLTVISSFASSTFLLLFAAINLSALRLHGRIGGERTTPWLGLVLSGASWLTLSVYMWRNSPRSLLYIGLFYLAVILAELLFSERRVIRQRL